MIVPALDVLSGSRETQGHTGKHRPRGSHTGAGAAAVGRGNNLGAGLGAAAVWAGLLGQGLGDRQRVTWQKGRQNARGQRQGPPRPPLASHRASQQTPPSAPGNQVQTPAQHEPIRCRRPQLSICQSCTDAPA